ncbi:MAG: cell surface protein SprA [Lentimicrobiaceae bacterium]|nr:cell surface protein SprA [Lentimicrobiaceae bacterium]
MIFWKQAKFYFIPALIVFALYSAIWAIPVPEGSHYSGSASGSSSYSFQEDHDFLEEVDFFIESSDLFATPPAPNDTGLRAPIPPTDNNPLEQEFYSPFHLNTPPNVKREIEYDPKTHTYQFQHKIGTTPYGPGAYMDVNEYIDYDLQKEIRDYWRERGARRVSGPNRRGGGGIIPQLRVGGDVFETIFGSNTIDIRPSGNVELMFAIVHNSNKNPNVHERMRKKTDFKFDAKIQLSLTAKIGDKISFDLNYNTESNFDFDNKMKLKYEGKEDDIIQLLEFGDVTLPLRSSLITGSQTLFGAKVGLRFGKLDITAVASETSSQKQTINVTGGAQTQDFYFRADEYEDNRHFFIAQYFREGYNQAMSELPLIASNVVITKIEVWRTTIGAALLDNRNIVAFTDLGESNPSNNMFTGFGGPPNNGCNNLFNIVDSSRIRNMHEVTSYLRGLGLAARTDYELVESARLLSPNEYTYNSKLGFISLSTPLQDNHVLAVAFQYQLIGDDKVYQVGEFSNEVFAPQTIRVKLLKSTNLDIRGPLWRLMMKNVYSIGGYQISPERFRLNILFSGDEEGIPNGFFTNSSSKGIPLIRLMGLDRLNTQLDPFPDGIFDFIDGADINGGTIVSRSGKVFFPTIEPFGQDLRVAMGYDPVSNTWKNPADEIWANRYAFDSLYTMTKTMAQQFTSKNKYFLEGQYRSAYGAEYSLNAWNIPQGSVVVNAGGMQLIENVDFTVNYSTGTVTITNDGILKSGTPISISVENNSMFGINKKRFFGVNVEYNFSENFIIGATLLNMSERPMYQKVNFGNEPINNMIWGMNLAYKTKVPWVTKLVDFLPFHSTTTESTLQIEGEFAHFVPGHSRVIGKDGTTYIDDFEGARSTVDLRQFGYWHLASTPQGQPDKFREVLTVDSSADPRIQLAYGYNRARLSWYIIDQLFYNNTSATPRNISRDEQSRPYSRAVYEPELFPKREYASVAVSTYMPVLNLAFFPEEKGPFNYDVDGREGFSKGINRDGTLIDPASRWGGMMRRFDNTDFEANNYEFIEFWMMDPFIDNPEHKGGKLYFNLGDISEDILRDGRKFFEDGLPPDERNHDDSTLVAYTVWGRVPTIQQIVNAFENNDNRRNQDVGYDGLSTERERLFFDNTYLRLLRESFGDDSKAYSEAWRDPSGDDYRFYRGQHWDNDAPGEPGASIIQRYKYFNNSEGNSTENFNNDPLLTNTLSIASSLPNSEDINNDNTMSEDEKYYQWSIDIHPDMMNVGHNYINDMMLAIPERLPNGTNPPTKWYQFRIPVKSPEEAVGAINGLNSIRFMRVYLRGFEEPIVLRLATFELVRNTWRSYTQDLLEDGDYLPGNDGENTEFLVGTVSLEENGNRKPINYKIPPGIDRLISFAGMASVQLNEQSVSMRVKNLQDGDARAIFKSVNFDMRQFKKLEMFIHAEKMFEDEIVNDDDVSVFIRLGSDFSQNYYEYEIPAKMSPWWNNDTASIWPLENRMMIILDTLVNLKQRRNIKLRRGEHINVALPYSEYIYENGNRNRISVVGMPNLGSVTTIMIGVRNPKKRSPNDGDDMLPKSVEVWVNELRLSGFNDRSGAAALGRVRMNLADLGDVALAGTITTPGYGGLEQSVTQRQMATTYSVDFATNLDGGKILFPKNWNIKIPFHYDFSMQGEIPEYNPLNPDVKLKNDLKTYSPAERDSIRKITNYTVKRNNVNVTNVRKERNLSGPLKMRPWDVENLDFSYAYAEVSKHDADMEFDNQRRHEGEIGYTFSHNPKNFKVGSKPGLKSNWLQIIRDLNITPLPKSFTFRTSIVRDFNEFKYRPKSQGNIIIDTSFVKTFNWLRNYSLQWDITTSLRFTYNAQATARLEEPQGLIDTREKKDSVWRSFGQGGLMTFYTQRFDVSYQIPINKIPIFNWITANFRYAGDYKFTGAPLSLRTPEMDLGNTIENSNQLQLTGQANLVTLYNLVPYLKKINSPTPQRRDATPPPPRFGTPPDKNKKSNKDSVDRPNYGKIIGDGTLRFLMMVRNVNFSWSQGKGSLLPGYMHTPNLFGINFEHNSPGFLYVFGGQPNISKMAIDRGWLTQDTLQNAAFQERFNQTINFRAQVEPFRDFRIDVMANRTETWSYTAFLRKDAHDVIRPFSEMTTGTFNITYVGLKTFFKKSDDLFEAFRGIRLQMAKRIAENNLNSNPQKLDSLGYPDGYSTLSQEVLMYSFMASYMGKNAEKMNISTPFLKIPLPNWQLRYNGLTKIKGMARVFQNFAIQHNYTCNYTIGNYRNNILFDKNEKGPTERDQLNNFIPENEIAQISMIENFNPLIGFDMTLTNSLMIAVKYNKGRNLALSFANNQITEMSSNELSVSAGYRFKDLKIGLNFAGAKRQIVSDLVIALGFSMRDNTTTLRRVAEDVSQVSSGMLTFNINASAEYQISSMVGLRFYYDQVLNKPYISTQYQNTNIEAGISVRLMLTQ